MGDCQNVEMRELLPERAAELLSPRDAARVDGHVAECEIGRASCRERVYSGV